LSILDLKKLDPSNQSPQTFMKMLTAMQSLKNHQLKHGLVVGKVVMLLNGPGKSKSIRISMKSIHLTFQIRSNWPTENMSRIIHPPRWISWMTIWLTSPPCNKLRFLIEPEEERSNVNINTLTRRKKSRFLSNHSLQNYIIKLIIGIIVNSSHKSMF